MTTYPTHLGHRPASSTRRELVERIQHGHLGVQFVKYAEREGIAGGVEQAGISGEGDGYHVPPATRDTPPASVGG